MVNNKKLLEDLKKYNSDLEKHVSKMDFDLIYNQS